MLIGQAGGPQLIGRAQRRYVWPGMDVIPFRDGLVARQGVYSDSMSILRQVGLLEPS
jgi:hypothetical protein